MSTYLLGVATGIVLVVVGLWVWLAWQSRHS